MPITEATKAFPLRVVLTVTTGRLLTQPSENGNGIGDLYEILGWMTNDSPFTHQLARFAAECKSWLYRWFPELGTAEAALSKLDWWLARDQTSHKTQAFVMWLAELQMLDPRIKSSYDVPRIPQDDHDRIDAVEELAAMAGPEKVVVVEVE